MTDFVSARTKRKFKAFLVWQEKEKKVGFEFPPREEGAGKTAKTAAKSAAKTGTLKTGTRKKTA